MKLLQQLESALKSRVKRGDEAKRSSGKQGKRKMPKVTSRYLEDEEESLIDAVQNLELQTMKALQRQIRAAGFKGALVHGGTYGPVVTYGGEEYRFKIVET